MTDIDRKRAAKAFAEYWKDRGDEKSDSQKVCGIVSRRLHRQCAGT